MKVNEQELLELLQELIRIESVNPTLANEGSGEQEIAHYLGNYMEKIGLEVRYQELGKNRTNVIGTLRGSGRGKNLMLNGHTDTVSLKGMDDPLNGRYESGKVYGRGAVDMKGGIAAMMMAVKAIVDSEIQLKGNVILTLVADEEYASAGTEAVSKKFTADAAIVCEPSDLDIVIAHRGFAWIKVNIHGKAAHGSLYDVGIDAITKAGKLLAGIEELGKEFLEQEPHPLLGSRSIHASLISGGIGLSTYPDKCTVELERRTLPGEDKKTVEEEIKALNDRLASEDEEFRADYEVFFYRPALEVTKDQLIVKTLENACKKVLDREPAYSGMRGWLDSAILAEVGIPTVIFGPGGDGMHAAVEYVDFESVKTTAEVLFETIIDFCNTEIIQ
ncbi:MAG: ArgE/DapE family deacylase [Candidatus Odinarchaeota archaeon]